jgi:hypothetical protein
VVFGLEVHFLFVLVAPERTSARVVPRKEVFGVVIEAQGPRVKKYKEREQTAAQLTEHDCSWIDCRDNGCQRREVDFLTKVCGH